MADWFVSRNPDEENSIILLSRDDTGEELFINIPQIESTTKIAPFLDEKSLCIYCGKTHKASAVFRFQSREERDRIFDEINRVLGNHDEVKGE